MLIIIPHVQVIIFCYLPIVFWRWQMPSVKSSWTKKTSDSLWILVHQYHSRYIQRLSFWSLQFVCSAKTDTRRGRSDIHGCWEFCTGTGDSGHRRLLRQGRHRSVGSHRVRSLQHHVCHRHLCRLRRYRLLPQLVAALSRLLLLPRLYHRHVVCHLRWHHHVVSSTSSPRLYHLIYSIYIYIYIYINW